MRLMSKNGIPIFNRNISVRFPFSARKSSPRNLRGSVGPRVCDPQQLRTPERVVEFGDALVFPPAAGRPSSVAALRRVDRPAVRNLESWLGNLGWIPAWTILLATLSNAIALDPTEQPANYISAHWDTEDGLPHNQVRCIFQTRDGYLWVGTQQGLARFDGLTFTVFNQHNTPAFPNNLITSFAETRDGSLWIGTSGGLARYQNGRFTAYGRADGLKADTVNSLCVAPDGSLWIGGRGGITRWMEGKFLNDIDTSAYDMLGLRFISVDRHKAMWLAAGFDALRYQDATFTHFGREEGLRTQSLRLLCEDVDGTMIAGTSGGLLRLQDGCFVPSELSAALSSQRVAAALVDSGGNLWIGSPGGLDRCSGGRVMTYTNHDGAGLALVEVLFEDREHCLWVGTSAGLYRLTDRRASLLPLEDGATEKLVNTMMQSRDGALWIGRWTRGVDRIQNGVTTHYNPGAPLSADPVTTLYETADGTIWFGNRGSAIERLQGTNLTRIVYQSGVATSRPVTAIYEDTDGELLLGISRRGLLHLSDGAIVQVPEALELTNDTVWTITRTRDGRLLMGTDRGLYERQAGRTWKLVALSGRSHPVGARALLEEEDGTLWIASEGDGLVRWRNGHERAYTSREGIVDDVLFTVLDDHHGSLWVNSARGISRIRKTEFARMDRGETASLNCLTFGRADGLLSASTAGNGARSALCLADGTILAATDKGVVMIDQSRVQINTNLPPVVIESVVVDDKPLAHVRDVTVPAGAYRLEFRYSALSLVAPQRLRFRYQLEGSDPGWIEAGYQRQVSYTHLSPGHYTFRVLACNNDGVWNETGASLPVEIQPHFYQTRSFIGLVATGGALAIFTVYWVRRRNRLRQMAKLEGLVEERTRQLKTAKDAAEAAVSARNEVIAALKQAEVESERLHKQLLETSHQAGMAEVASNVLHNVGNVLNSVNVSATLAADVVRGFKLPNLSKVVGLLDEHAPDLGAFMTRNPKGQQLPDYLRKLSEHMTGDQRKAVEELESLRKNVEHIKEIVMMQQNYARISGVREVVRAADLVEDSFRIDAGSFARHGVQLVRDYQEVPPLDVEKHKVLQILVNLIRNAKQACDERGQPDKQVIVRIAGENGEVKISVADNGVGIPPENMTRIFSHGFTTRKNGHGFGLHSGALAAKELGGSLSAHSEGPGKGATFTLALPCEQGNS
jgi:ligand-binding sensor domain-containing protein/signal transduction histidine kinase